MMHNMLVIDDKKELDALVSLMDEPNEVMFGEIRKKVLGYGKLAIPVLEEAWVNTLEDHDSDRIEGLIEEIRQEELILEFNNWAKVSNSNIFTGLVILTRYFQPDFDEELYTEKFEKLFRETWLEINDSLTALEKVKVLNHVFYSVYQFSGEPSSDSKSDTYFLNKLLDHKKGNPVSLGILYVAIAQRLNIPIFGVNLPDHFILSYMDDLEDMRLPDKYGETDVLFYLNAVNKGAIFTRNEVEHYITQMKIDSKPEFFLPCSNLNVIERMIADLILTFKKENELPKAQVLKRLLGGLGN